MDPIEPTGKTKLGRAPARGSYDRELINSILDEALFCHVGFVVEGQPFVIPTAHWRAGDRIYVHGSRASRLIRTLAAGAEACITVTLIDGLVLARSAFHHSINYRSVVILGKAEAVPEGEAENTAFARFFDHIAPGRWDDVRRPNGSEIRQTRILSLPITEASAKVRSGGPIDDDADYALDHWAGVIPLALTAGEIEPDPKLAKPMDVPEYLTDYSRARVAKEG